MRKMGLKVDAEATRYDMDGLVEAILQSVFGVSEGSPDLCAVLKGQRLEPSLTPICFACKKKLRREGGVR